MAQGLIDRLLTIVVTATVTSAAWIVAGSVYFDQSEPGDESVSARKSAAVTELPQVSRSPARASLTASNSAPNDAAGLVVPVVNVGPAKLRDTFTDERGGGARLHEALDIMAPAGTAVVAAGSGTIEKLFHSDAGGNTIYVRSNDRRTIHYYAHLREYVSGLKEGQRIARGQPLGTVGSSGNASPQAPHLHFAILQTSADAEWWEPATAINPYPLLRGT
jgi:peptidoglycan LD-endopeptidase LytH